MVNTASNPADLWNLQRLFVHFNERKGYLRLSDGGELIISSCDNCPLSYDRTYRLVADLFKGWELFRDLKLENPDRWISTRLQGQHLHTDAIRKIYQEVVQKNLFASDHPFAAVAVGKGDYDWISLEKDEKIAGKRPSWLFQFLGENGLTVAIANLYDRIMKNRDNQSIRRSFYQDLVAKWGEPRVQHVLQRHAINLQDSFESLRVRDVRKIYASFTQLTEKDLRNVYADYRRYTQNLPIPTVIKAKFESEKEKLQQRFPHLPETYDGLSPEQKTTLIQVVSPSRKEIDLLILANRIEGVIVGHRPFWEIHWFFHSDVYEDTEIAQVFQEILENQDHRQPDYYYAELWAKLLVKKEGSQHLENDLVGRLIPATHGEWYKITKVTNRWGKFTIFLESLSNPKKGRIEQCSSSVSWSSSKNFSTLLQDLNPLAPPGHLSGADFSDEMSFIDYHDVIDINGHSLGGPFGQRTVVKYFERLRETVEKIIKVTTFNSPGITEEDVKRVDEKKHLIPHLTIDHFFGFNDIVAFSGREHMKTSSAAFISPKGKITPELDVHPHCNYYFRNSDRLNNLKIERLTPEQLKNFGRLHNPFFAGNWNNPLQIDIRKYIVEPGRIIGGLIFAPILYPMVWLQENIKASYGIDLKNRIAHLIRRLVPFIVPTHGQGE